MRNLLLLTFLFFSTAVFGQGRYTQSYNGNGKSGFDGSVGGGKLSVTDTPDSLIFTLEKGSGPFDSVLVLYLDVVVSNPFSYHALSTSDFNGYTDKYKAAAVGATTTAGQNAVLNFPSDFHPNVAVAFDNEGGQVFNFANILGNITVNDGATFTVAPSGTNSAPVYTVGESKTKLGVTGNVSFKFIGTYIGPNASRSNEGFAESFATYTRTARTASYNPWNVTAFFGFASTLPVKLTNFKAAKEKDGVNISWSVAQETGIEAYEVQRSVNGTQFITLQTVKARNGSGPATYSVKDANPAAGGNHYRLTIQENGARRFSDIVHIGADRGKSSFAANYRPGNVLTLSLNGIDAGAYNVLLVNSSGQLVHAFPLQHNGSNTTETRNLQGDLSKGIYRVVLQSAGEKHTAAILVQ